MAAKTVTELPVGARLVVRTQVRRLQGARVRAATAVCTCSPGSCATSPPGSRTSRRRSPSSATWSSTASSWCGGPAGSTSPPCRTGSAPVAVGCTGSSRQPRPRSWCSTCSPATARTCATGRTGSAGGSWRSSSASSRRPGAHPGHHGPRGRPQLDARHDRHRYRGRGREAARPALPARDARLAEAPHPDHRRGDRRRYHRAVDAPRELILGRHDEHGRLRIAGRTTTLQPATATRLGAVLEEQAHAWPERLPAHSWGAPRTAYTRVRPDLVVEVSADLALDGLRWRHPVRFVRARDDLRASDLPSRVL